jgi:hypothetical protein
MDPLTLALVLAARAKRSPQRRAASDHTAHDRMIAHHADNQAKREAREQLRKMKRRSKRQRKESR